MDTSEDEYEPVKLPAKAESVTVTILTDFFDALENEEGFNEIARRLRKVVLEDSVFAEPAIRAALFSDAS